MDALYEKLLLLDNMARKTNNNCKERTAMIVTRFNAHKSKPSFVAALVLNLLCSKEEEAVLEKEQKLLKCFGMGMQEHSKAMQPPCYAGFTNTPFTPHSSGAWPWALAANFQPDMQTYTQGLPLNPRPGFNPCSGNQNKRVSAVIKSDTW